MLRLENITKRFGPVVANDRISLEVRAGEVLALLGENGAGKTTLVSLLYGLYAPDEGRILLEGRPVQIPSPKAAQARGIALVPQHPELIEAHTVAENLALGLDLPFLLPRRALVRRLKALLAGHPLGVDLEAPVHLLSAGEKQRVEILRALLAKPKVLILDEPTSVLTPQEAEGLFQEIARYKAMGLAVIFISHKLDEVLRVADRIAVLRGGREVGEVPREKADRDLLVRLMVGREVEPPRLGFPPGKRPLLEVRDLFVPRRGVPVQGVSFVLWEGEILGVAGVAGSGQKELCETLTGLMTAKKGAILYHKENIVGKTPAEIIKLGISMSFVPEDRLGMGLVASMGMVDNMLLKSYTEGKGPFVERKPARELAQKLVEKLAIVTPGVDTPVRLMSGGNVQKVLLGREIESSPQVLITAYPVRGLDINSSYTIYDLLNEQKKKGVAVIYIGEDLDVLLELSDRLMVLCHGKVTGVVDAKTVTKEQIGLMMTGAEAAEAMKETSGQELSADQDKIPEPISEEEEKA